MIKPTGKFKQSDNSAQNEQKDVTHTRQNAHITERSFCLSELKNKWPRLFQNPKPENSSKLIAVPTRQNPYRNTFDIHVKKRKCEPNKKQLLNGYKFAKKNFRDNSTQTDRESNKRNGLSAPNDEKHTEVFTSIV